jgi:hypothetical protein
MRKKGNLQNWSIFIGPKQIQKKIWSLETLDFQQKCRFPLFFRVKSFLDHNLSFYVKITTIAEVFHFYDL